MPPSKWSKRLEQRLSALADAASKESLQTLARWIVFNRKHSSEFTPTFLAQITEASLVARSWLCWQLLDQILSLDKDDVTKYDRFEDLRVSIGDAVIVPAMREIKPEILANLKPLIQEWDNINVFGGPTLINQIKRAAAAASSKSSPPSPPGIAKEDEPTGSKSSMKSEPPEAPMSSTKTRSKEVSQDTANTAPDAFPEPDGSDEAPTNTPPKPSPEPVRRLPSITSPTTFDFESSGIPAGKVEGRQFLDPCKAVATLQITRDLRSESAIRLKSILSTIPKDIRDDMETYYQELQETGELPQIDHSMVEAYSVGISDEVLDLNVEEALENVRTFREITQKLKTAREKLIHLLIKSRCNFGSEEAAEAFYGLDEVCEKLQKRKEMLVDAMDLEGLDPPPTEEPDDNAGQPWMDGIGWYNPDGEPDAKRHKVA
jgi:hypothetical protein